MFGTNATDRPYECLEASHSRLHESELPTEQFDDTVIAESIEYEEQLHRDSAAGLFCHPMGNLAFRIWFSVRSTRHYPKRSDTNSSSGIQPTNAPPSNGRSTEAM
jgi:hypothetical protein